MPYKNHSDKLKAGKRFRIRRMKLLKDFQQNYLETHPCLDCGETDPIVLDFDHVRGVKLWSISHYITKQRGTLKKFEEEIAKCEIRCANCHRRRHHKEKIKSQKKIKK